MFERYETKLITSDALNMSCQNFNKIHYRKVRKIAYTGIHGWKTFYQRFVIGNAQTLRQIPPNTPKNSVRVRV